MEDGKMIAAILTVLYLVCALDAFPLPHRMVDMSYVFDKTTPNHPYIRKFKIDNLFNGTNADLDNVWFQLEEYSSSPHSGTHMDAQSHFTLGGLNVDEIPLNRLVGPAAVVDISVRAVENPDTYLTVDDLLQWETTTGRSLNGTIVLLRTGWGLKWNNSTAFHGTPDNDMYNLHFPGISPEAAQWIVDNRNLKGYGTETLSLDQGQSRDFLSHRILLRAGIYGLENVANMDKLPIFGAQLFVLPMKIGKGSGAPTRIMALIPEIIYDSPVNTEHPLTS